MTAKEYMIQKVKMLPDEMVRELRDFLDFLESRREKNEWKWLAQGSEKAVHDDFSDYQTGIESYEDMLEKGKIKWK